MIERITTPERENSAAAWGTACHQIAERCLHNGLEAAHFIGNLVKTDEHEFEFDDEMAVTTQEYLDYVRERLASEAGAQLSIEQHFSLAALKPPIESGGTGDAVIWFPRSRLLEIVDLKGGRGVVVEAVGNKQERTYAVGVMLKFAGYPVERIRTTIVQPRAPHKDGRIRSDEFHVADLVEWTAELLARMRLSVEATRAFGTMAPAAWVAKYLSAGDHCTFCRAKEGDPLPSFDRPGCPAIVKQVEDQIGLWFDADDKPRIANAPQSMTPEQLAQLLDAADLIEDHVNSCRAYARAQAESGVSIPNYQLVEKIGHRKWKGDEEAVAKALYEIAPVDVDFYDRKLKSPAQVEKVLGAKRKALIEPLVHRPVTGVNLVRVDKTSRAAVASRPERYFEPVTEERN